MPGEEAGATEENTITSVGDLDDEIEELAGVLGSVIDSGHRLATETGWTGKAQERFLSIWEEGGWDGGQSGATDVTSALNMSIDNLRGLSSDADTSAQTMIDEDVASAGGIE